jgi:hypothetical protein
MVPISVGDNVTKHSGTIPNVMWKGDPAGVSVEKSIVPRGASAASSCITSLSSSLLCMADSHFARARSSREDHHVCVSIVCLLYASAPCSALHRYLLSRSTSHLVVIFSSSSTHTTLAPRCTNNTPVSRIVFVCRVRSCLLRSLTPFSHWWRLRVGRVVFYTLVPLIRPLVACELCCVLCVSVLHPSDPSSSQV